MTRHQRLSLPITRASIHWIAGFGNTCCRCNTRVSRKRPEELGHGNQFLEESCPMLIAVSQQAK